MLPILPLLLLLSACRENPGRPPTAAEASPDTAASAPEKVTLALNWFPEAEHGGFYAAKVMAFYAEEGLDVEIVSGGVDVPVVPRVATGRVTFGVANADDILMGRAEGAPVVALMAPIQRSPRCLMVHESSGFTAIGDIKGITLAMSERAAFAHFVRANAPLTGVRIVPYPGNVAPFLLDEKYGMQGYVFSEPYVAQLKGAKPRVLLVADMGYNPYTSLLFATEKTIRERPELVEKMTRASVRGWKAYLEDPVATNREINRLNPEMDMEILRFGVEQLQGLVLTPETLEGGVGAMTAERWETLGGQLSSIGLIKPEAVDAKGAWTAKFLEAPAAVD